MMAHLGRYMLGIQDYWVFLDFAYRLVFLKHKQKNATFGKQIQFPKRCVILLILEYRTMDKIQEPRNPYRYTP
jgi:hypothetical protein